MKVHYSFSMACKETHRVLHHLGSVCPTCCNYLYLAQR